MRRRLFWGASLLGLAFAFTPLLSGQNTNQAASVPDISGVWMVAKIQPALFPNGGAPLQPWAEAKFKTNNLNTNDPNLACLPEGVPRIMFVPEPMEILQLPTRILIIHESIQVLRQIYMNRQHSDDSYPTYSGDSVGKWEGDTLVVDTIG